MAISINWATKVITVPQSYLTSVGGSIYELDVDQFRLDLKNIEDSEEGMSFDDTHAHNTEVVLSGVTYARFLQIINGYTITFEDIGSPYTVKCVGANHNIADVKNVNQVSLIIGNSAGLIVTSTTGGTTAADIWSYGNRALTQAVAVSGIPQVNVVQVSGEYVSADDSIVNANIIQVAGTPVTLDDFGGGPGGSGATPAQIWSYASRSLTQAVAVSGIPAVNTVQVSGEYVRKEDLQGPGSSLTTSAIANAVWDEILTGATHNIPTSAGRRLRQIASNIIYDGIATSATINTITFDGGASTVDGEYDPGHIYISAGKGVGQSRLILEYKGSTKTAVVDRDWKNIPDATSEVIIMCDAGREHVNEGLARAGSSMTIQLNALASTQPEAYKGQLVFIRSGTGADQARRVASYNGATQTATMSRAWDIVPSSDSAYVMLPTGMISDACIANAVWNSASGSLVTDLLTKMAPLLIGTVTGAGTNEEVYTYGGRTVKVYATPEGNVTSVVFS